MTDMHSALATERSQMFLTQARHDGIVRLARCCAPNAVLAAARSAWTRTVHWLRQGQLGGYPQTCCV